MVLVMDDDVNLYVLKENTDEMVLEMNLNMKEVRNLVVY